MIIERVHISRAVLAVGITAAIGMAAACRPAPADRPSTTAAQAPAATAAAAPVSLEHGRDLYKANCAPCHGEQGHGDGPAAAGFNPKPRNHSDAAYMSKLTDEDIAKVIQYGGAMKGMPLMPSNPVLKGADLQAVIAYTRSLSTGKTVSMK
jgi:mono/diheme cytochrome c family protein